MPIEHLTANASAEQLFQVIQRDGCVVVDRMVDRATVEQVNDEMAPYVAASPKGADAFDGFETRRAGMAIARSPKSRELIMHPTVLDLAGRALAHATTFQLHVTQMIAVGPGSVPQNLHRDQWTFDMFPFPQGFDTTFSTMWAFTDFTQENGATRLIPGSHEFEDKLEFASNDAEPAEMEAGSVLFYTGSVYHGAGANRTESVRTGFISQYTLGWLRQEENQYLSVPADVLQTLPEGLLRLMGYQHGAYSIGFIDYGRDPMGAIRPELEREFPVVLPEDAMGLGS